MSAHPKPGPKKKKVSSRKRRGDPALLAEVRSMPCVACPTGKQVGPSDPDHITTVGAGGKDLPNNLWPLCRSHHIERGNRGLVYMADTYPGCSEWLEDNGRLEEILSRRIK